MTLVEFKEKVNALWAKSGMREDVFWPIVYDEDEIGEILINENGQIFFADKCANWVDSRMNVSDISNLRYKSVETPTRTDRDIYINFTSGDFIKMRNWKKNSIVYTTAAILKTEENGEFLDGLKESCECYDNARGNSFYITIRKAGK